MLDKQAKNIQWLEFELSNNCQYRHEHKWCPLSQDTRPLTFLKTYVVHKVIQFFKKYDFAGRVYFSGYSEPLLDPRLTELVKYTKKHLPRCNIDMFTNGVACDENLLSDLIDVGVDCIRLSAYSESERQRFKSLLGKKVMIVEREIGSRDNDIDGRMDVYSQKGIEGKCFMPTLYYFVRNNGDVNMCFWDWKYTQTFGNLYKSSVESTLLNENRLNINKELVKGNRPAIPVCDGCKLPTHKCIREYQDRMVL